MSKGQISPQIELHEHFLGINHNGIVNDCTITFIDKTDPKNPCEREDFGIIKLKTMKPFGLNIQESSLFYSINLLSYTDYCRLLFNMCIYYLTGA